MSLTGYTTNLSPIKQRVNLKEVNFDIIEVRITKYITQKSLRTTQFTEILEIKHNSFQLKHDDLNLS